MKKPITLPQKEQFGRMAKDAWANAIEIALEQLESDGEISLEGLQRVLGKGNRIKSRSIQFLKELILELAAEPKPYLKLISGGKKVIIGATDGKDVLANAGDVFTGFVDGDFANWGLTEPADPTEECATQVHELVQDGIFEQIYKGLDTELGSLCLTQAQIKKFCVERREWLRKDGYGTFFLFKKNKKKPATPENLFVARVGVYGDGRLGVSVYQFSRGIVWRARCAHRFVLPQLVLAN